MIRYTPAKQLTLEGFSTPFSQQLSTTNRWVILAAKIPWDKLADVYYKKMRADFGAPTLSARMVIGAVIIKHILKYPELTPYQFASNTPISAIDLDGLEATISTEKILIS